MPKEVAIKGIERRYTLQVGDTLVAAGVTFKVSSVKGRKTTLVVTASSDINLDIKKNIDLIEEHTAVSNSLG